MDRAFPLRLCGWLFVLSSALLLCKGLLLGAGPGAGPGDLRGETVLPLEQADVKILGARALEEVSDAKAAGDHNGDGFGDIIIGSELARVGDVRGAGRAFLVYGAAGLPPVIDLAGPGPRGVAFEVSGTTNEDRLGHAVSGAGDVNGDGADDFMIAAPFAADHGSRTGVVYLIFGGSTLPPLVDLAALGSRGVKIIGPELCALAGNAISRAGDVNGDGFDDLLIGAEGTPVPGRGAAGAAYIVFGAASLPETIELSALRKRGVTIQGEEGGDRLGAAVASLGDFNGDGRPDVIVAAPDADLSSRGDAGKVYVIFGASSMPAKLDLLALGARGIAIEGVETGDRTGNSVAGAGDWDHDGFADALIGADSSSTLLRPGAGKSYVVFGGTAVPPVVSLSDLDGRSARLEGVGGGDGSGHAVYGVADFNGDGIPDLIAGSDKAQPRALGNAGQTHIVFGSEAPRPIIDLRSLGANGVYLNGERAGDMSGSQVAEAGDVNGDGATDTLVVSTRASASAPGTNGGSPRMRAGVVHVILGTPLRPVSDLACTATAERGVRLAWTRSGAYEAVAIRRNGADLARLPGGADSYFDATPPIGVVVYEVRGRAKSAASLPARCEVSVRVRPPFGLNCVAIRGAAHLSWQQAQPFDETRIYRDGEQIAALPRGAEAYRDSSAAPGAHEYRVSGVIGLQESDPAVCMTSVPASVQGLSCSIRGSSVTLSWTNTRAGATGISINRDGVELAVISDSSSSYVDGDAPVGERLYQVQALSGQNASAAAECRVRVLGAVTGLAGSSDAGHVLLRWTTGDEYDSIQVLRDGILVATLEGAADSYSEDLAQPGTYAYTVVGNAGAKVPKQALAPAGPAAAPLAPSGGGFSKPALLIVQAPAPVEDLACSADGDQATLTWRHGGDCDSIEVLRDGVLAATLDGEAELYQETLPGPGSYSYEVVCVEGGGSSAPAECELIAPAAPEPAACTLVNGIFQLSWTPNGDYDSFEVVVNGELQAPVPGDQTSASYDLGVCGAARAEVRGVNGASRSSPAVCEASEVGAPFSLLCFADELTGFLSWRNGGVYDAVRVAIDDVTVANLPGDTESHELTLPGRGTFKFEVFGVVGGAETLPAVCHATVSAAVLDLRCTTDGERVLLTWKNLEQHQSVRVSRNGLFYANLPSGSQSFLDLASLTGKTTYSVRLSILGSSGLSTTCDVEVLPAPAGLACVSKAGAVHLTWTNPAVYSSIVILRNGVEVSPAGGLPGTATSFVDKPVSPGKHTYEVQGLSGASAQSRVARCEVEVLAFPIRLVCTSFDAEVCLRWENPRPYDEIRIYSDGALVAMLPGTATSYCQENLLPGDYSYDVRGISGGNESEGANCLFVVPDSPFDVSCVQRGSDVLLSYTSPQGGDAIMISRDGDLLATVPTGSATPGAFLDTNVPLGTHTYELRGGMAGDFSKAAVCSVEMLSPPLDISCVSEGTAIKVCWTPGAAYDIVIVERNGESIHAGPPPAGNCITDENLPPGVYGYTVRGQRGSDESRTASCSAIIVAPIFNLHCQITGDRAVLSWSNGAPYTEIEILRKKPSDAAPVLLATLPGSPTSYTDEPLSEAGTYSYLVVGKAQGVRSTAASCSARLLAPPAVGCFVVNATVSFADVELTWTNGDVYDEIIIRRNGTVIAALPGTATAYIDTAVDAGTYDYELTGVRGADASAPAHCTAQVHLVPPPITNFNCRIDGNVGILSWTADGTADETHVYRRAPGEAQSSLLATLPGTPTSFTDNNAALPGDYRYEVTHVRNGLESSRAICNAHKPKAPVELKCLAANLGLNDGDVHLSWVNAEVYDGIEVLRDGVKLASLAGSATSFLDPDRPIGTYAYRLIAIVGSNRSDLSAECRVEVPVAPPAVDELLCSIENGVATIRWKLGAIYEAIEIRRRKPDELELKVIATLPGDQTSYEDSGLAPAGTYLYSVTGLIAARSSDAASCTVVLPVAPVVAPECAVKQVADGKTDVLLSWENKDAYDSIVVVRIRKSPAPSETTLVNLPGDQTSYLDQDVPDGTYDYAVVGVIGQGSATSAACPVTVDSTAPLTDFIRGEINNDGRTDVADAVYLFNYIFAGGPTPTCFDAADANDDGDTDISDAIWIIVWQFYAGAPPKPPFPACGVDPTADELGCESYPRCP